MKEALYYKKLNNDSVQCLLCPKLCKIREGKSGFCGARENIGTDTPLHFSRYFPHYKMRNTSITPIETLEQAYEIAKKKLKHVYLGNIVI